VYTGTRHGSLLTLRILRALYGGAAVILKPVFGALADRLGGKPVLIGRLLAFAAASGGFLLAASPAALLAAPGAGAGPRRSAGRRDARRPPRAEGPGRAFGSYGAWTGLGYALGPLPGAPWPHLADTACCSPSWPPFSRPHLGQAVAGWALLAVPAAPPPPRHRRTLAALTRSLSAPAFLGPPPRWPAPPQPRRPASGSCPYSATRPVLATSPPVPPSRYWPPPPP